MTARSGLGSRLVETSALLVAVALAAAGCKSKVLTDAETYEQEACSCKHGDFACAREKSEKLEPLLRGQVQWNETAPDPVALERHRDTGAACLKKVWSCGDDEKCPSGFFCQTHVEDDRGRYCAPILAAGAPCGDIFIRECGPGLRCEIDPRGNVMDFRMCDPGPCGPPPGKCVAASASAAPAAPSASAAPGAASPSASAAPAAASPSASAAPAVPSSR